MSAAVALETIQLGPQPGPQTKFFETTADIGIYGGSAGSGKSYALLLEPLRHLNNPLFGGVIFRRNTTQVRNEGGLWDESVSIYSLLGARPREAQLEWNFPSGMRMKFAHLEHAKSVYDWQGSQIPFCVARGTLVRLADGSNRAIEKIKPGDLVETLQGPRKVTKTHGPFLKKQFKLSAGGKVTTIGDSHSILMASGTWASPGERITTQSSEFDSTVGFSMASSLNQEMLTSPPLLGHSHIPEPWQQICPKKGPPENAFSRVDDRTDSLEFGGEPQAIPPPLMYFGHAMLCQPSPQSGAQADFLEILENEDCRDHVSTEATLNSRLDCHAECGFYGEQPLLLEGVSPKGIPLLIDVGGQIFDSHEGGREQIRLHTQTFLKYEYFHPYTNIPETSCLALYPAPAYISPAGEGEVFDLTVDEVSHYITSSGLVSKNCGFDELTHFTESQFWYMLSRNRSTSGVPGYIRCTTNPDADSWVRRLIDWWIGPDGLAIPERSSVIRWFIRIGGKLIWGDSREELIARHGDVLPKSLTFIAAKLEDNKILAEKDPAYKANLDALNVVDRARLRDGNWNIRATAGNFFKRQWFPIKDAIPSGWSGAIRFWDRAATKVSPENPDPDWTRGLKMLRYPDGSFGIVDLKSLQGTPGEVEILIKTVASHDSFLVKIMAQQDPGSAGVAEALQFTKLLVGYNVRTLTFSKDKETRAKAISAQAEAGNVWILRAPWNEEFLSELEGFPAANHDDCVDVASGAFNDLCGGHSLFDVK